jgi:hypothetical protein
MSGGLLNQRTNQARSNPAICRSNRACCFLGGAWDSFGVTPTGDPHRSAAQGKGSVRVARGHLAKHRAHARRSQAAFYVPRSELRKLLPGN